MGRLCTICTSGQRALVDDALVAHQLSYRRIAAQFALDETCLRRHERQHLAMSWRQSKELAALMNTERLVERIEAMERVADDVLKWATRVEEQRLRLLVMREVRANVELLFKIGTLSDVERRLAALEAGNGTADSDDGDDGGYEDQHSDA